jgi:hypothetical protein
MFSKKMVEHDFGVVMLKRRERRALVTRIARQSFSPCVEFRKRLRNEKRFTKFVSISARSVTAAVVLVFLHRRRVAALGDGPLPHRLPIQTARARRHH